MVSEFNPNRTIVGIPFSKANAVTEQTNTDLVLAGGGTIAVMPKAGCVVGISANLSADVTAGSATVKVHKDSTELTNASAPTLTLSDTVQESYASVRPNAVKFSAGDGLGVSYSSTTDFAPTNTNDLDAVLYVAFDPD